ncbi:MAG: hypothetical protein RL492_1795 [Verrucomicrobiota bacterium]|jgi:predicted dienelactone hydrolase
MKALLFLFLSVLTARAELVRGQVELAGLKGAITVQSYSDLVVRPLMAGDVLREDDELATPLDGSAELVFSNGVRVLVASGSRLRLSMFRQVKMPSPSRRRDSGELPDDGSIVDLSLGSGRVTIVCPPLQARSLVSVRTPQGRSDLAREGVYELSFERTAGGELLAQSLVLTGSLRFTPAGKGHAQPFKVEANNKLLVTSEPATPTQVNVEKLKMETGEVDLRLKAAVFDPTSDLTPPVAPKTAPLAPPAPSVGSSSGSTPVVVPSEQTVQQVTQEVLERQAQTNPSPTGG